MKSRQEYFEQLGAETNKTFTHFNHYLLPEWHVFFVFPG